VTLRAKLVLAMIALLTAVSIAIGVISVLALENFLVGRLDSQLTSATGRSEDALGGNRGPGANGPGDVGRGDDDSGNDGPGAGDFVALPGQREGTLAGLVEPSGVITAAVLGDRGTAVQLSDEQSAKLVNASLADDGMRGQPVTINLGRQLGEYRVVTQPTALGGQLIIGLPLREVDETVRRLAILVLGIGLVGVIAAAAAGAGIVRLSLRPLDRVADAARRVALIPLDRGDVDLSVRVAAGDANPATEVGKVGAAVNRMLDHVALALVAREASESRVRTFVADASHELRTPLAAIRGYSELTRRAGHDLPDDIVHAMARVESETVRMTALVEDLLLLARIDEGNPLARGQVDLVELVHDTVADAAVAGPEHDWVALDAPVPIIVDGDPVRLHQVVANLLENARRHTPAGTTVTVGAAVDGTEAVVEVSDSGPGVDPALAPRIFERFVRGDASRSRHAGSTGLGLSIVAAVIEAHGGTVGLRTRDGATVFWFRLPLSSALVPN
jgi:two-component system, OmpR family, sensor kinase